MYFLLSVVAKRSTKVKERTSVTQTSTEATSGSVKIGPNIAYEGVGYFEEAIYEHPI